MSYIINSINPFASTKVTEKGREKLAKGKLTFKSWAIGDSEINYERELLVDNVVLSGSSRILRPKDKQPDLRYFINKGGVSPLVPFGSNDIKCIKAIVNNKAKERGFFNGSFTSGYTTNTTLTSFLKTYGTISGALINGGKTFTLSGIQTNDIILFKIGNSVSDSQGNTSPNPMYWYKAQSVVSGVVTVDRVLPNLNNYTVAYYIYSPGEVYDNEPNAISYWDTGTLAFDNNSDVTITDVPVWNLNNIYGEDILGVTGTTEYEKYINYGSYDYFGEKENYLYNSNDNFKKNIGIIHYTNKTISNLYGEFLFIDNVNNKTVNVNIPNLMYHRRKFSGSTTGNSNGMRFIASGVTQNIGTSGLNYINLIEDPSLVNGIPQTIGRVFPDLKIIVIDDSEILAAMSYKSNRNWTLPKLKLTPISPVGGVGNGVLPAGFTIYVTYAIDNNSGIGLIPALPCQNYAILHNTQNDDVDIQFNINDIGLLPYMRNSGTGDGFYGDTFKILYQVTTNNDRPISNAWKELDFTSSVLSGSLINVTTLETQNPLSVTPNFQITNNSDINSSIPYSIIDTLTMPLSSELDNLQFGDERFFYGNIETFIGATIYKTLFNISINASEFNKTTNISRSPDPTTNPPLIEVSEVGIYDNDDDLVIISKLSKPIKLILGATIMIELSIDF